VTPVDKVELSVRLLFRNVYHLLLLCLHNDTADSRCEHKEQRSSSGEKTTSTANLCIHYTSIERKLLLLLPIH
jgi:hypothetical protein